MNVTTVMPVIASPDLLTTCEEVIQRGLATFIEVGEALTTIRNGRLYKSTHKTFEEYCRGKWGMTRMRASQLIGAAEVVSNVNHGLQAAPASERVTRPLAKLPAETQREVWKEAVETAPEGKVTAKHVESVCRSKEQFSDEANARGKEAEEDSEKLWALKSAWRRCGKRDREQFQLWILTQDKPAQSAQVDESDYTPSNGLTFAKMAISQLQRIHPKDVQRTAALKIVETWVEAR